MDVNDDYADPEFLEQLADSHNRLNESFESLTRLIEGHGALVHLLEASSGLSMESFEAMARPTMIALCAGTDVDPDDVVLSTEAVGGAILKLGRTILEVLQRFFKNFMEFMTHMDLAASWLKRDLHHIQKKVAASRGKQVDSETVTLGRQYKYLRFGPYFADDSIKLERELKALKHVVQVMSTDYVNSVIQTSTQLHNATRGKSGEALTDGILTLIEGLPFAAIAGKVGMQAAPYERFSRSNVMTSGPTLGGKSIFFFDRNLREKGVRGFKFYGFFYETTGREEPQVAPEREFPTLNPAQIGKIPEAISELLELISKQTNVSMRSRINRTKASLDSYVQSTSSTPMTSEDIDAIRKTVMSLTYWMKNPVSDLYLTSMSVCRAAVSYCKKSVHTYR